MRVLERVISIFLGILCVLGGIVALAYMLEGFGSLNLIRENLLGSIVGVAVPGVLSASAFYMAFRLIRTNKPEKQ
jgi:hypothetical protein